MGSLALLSSVAGSDSTRPLSHRAFFFTRLALVSSIYLVGAATATGQNSTNTSTGGSPTSIVANGPASGNAAASHVLVLYNSADANSVQIANYYQQVHPGVHLLGLTGVPSGDDISASQYLSIIRPQVMAGLGGGSINDIVTTKGLPLRIDNPTPQTLPYSYSDALGPHTVYSTSWGNYESLEGALTRVSLASTWQQLCDQTWWSPTPDQAQNPYFNATTSFSHTNSAMQGMYLTSRLDGYTVANVESEINNAQNVSVSVGAEGFLIDNTSSGSSYGHTSMPQLISNVLAPSGQSFVYNTTATPATTAPFPVVGYDSYGTNEGLAPGYITNQLKFPVAAGAIFESWESYNAYSFTPGVTDLGQGLLADWIAKGGAAGVGNVAEPDGWLWAVTNENVMFQMMLEGYTWAEAAWAATPRLDYVDTVIGDPLMTWNVSGVTATPTGGGGVAFAFDEVPEPTTIGIAAIVGTIGLAGRRRNMRK